MAFKKQGKSLSSENNIKIITEPTKKIASETKIICKNCKKVIGTKLGDIYQILDGRFLSLKGCKCQYCKKIYNINKEI